MLVAQTLVVLRPGRREGAPCAEVTHFLSQWMCGALGHSAKPRYGGEGTTELVQSMSQHFFLFPVLFVWFWFLVFETGFLCVALAVLEFIL